MVDDGRHAALLQDRRAETQRWWWHLIDRRHRFGFRVGIATIGGKQFGRLAGLPPNKWLEVNPAIRRG
jgi:hypothetical protein